MSLKQLKINKKITLRESQAVEKYLQQVQATSRLSIEEEIEYTKLIKQGEEAERLLKEKRKETHQIVNQSKATKDPVLKRKATNALRRLNSLKKKTEEAVAKAKKAKDKLILGNLRFVISAAKQYQNRGLSINDLINEGNIGLIKASTRFDETRGFKFISYAVWWIRQCIIQAIHEKGGLLRKPGTLTALQQKIYKAYKVLTKKLERDPTAQEIAEKLNIPVETVFSIQESNVKPLSIDAPFKQGEESTLMDIVKNEEANVPEEKLMNDALREDLERMIDKLDQREQKVIRDYFGIGQENGFSKTLEDIGKESGITRERARQIREQAIKKLRKFFFQKTKRQQAVKN